MVNIHDISQEYKYHIYLKNIYDVNYLIFIDMVFIKKDVLRHTLENQLKKYFDIVTDLTESVVYNFAPEIKNNANYFDQYQTNNVYEYEAYSDPALFINSIDNTKVIKCSNF